MQSLYAILACFVLVGGLGFFFWREAKKSGYNTREIEQVHEAVKQREESKRKVESVDAMCRSRRQRAKSWLREKVRSQKLRDG